MENANKDEQMLEEFFDKKEYVLYRKDEDPEQKMFEAVNLADLLGNALSTVGQLGLTGGHLDIWLLRRKIRGFYDFDPFPNWKGRRVRVTTRPSWGEGTIKAVKKVGNWHIPGVEFDKPVVGGHFLKFRDEGDQGKAGHCHWIWLDNLEFIYQDQE
jgi:hypothetical protein